jgi:hypothetical protein
MNPEETSRKHLDNQEFLRLRQATEKMARMLSKRLRDHLEVVKPLFVPRGLLGNYIKSSTMEDVPGSDKAFAELQERFARVCEKPFGLPRKLQPPLPPIPHPLEMTPFQYPLNLLGAEDKPITVTSPTRWILSYRSDCPLNRLQAMVSGAEPRQPEEMRQSLINHLALVIYLKHFPPLSQLLEDLRYQVETRELPDLGGLPIVMLKAPVATFLPPDDFILQITQLSGIAAFQEIIDPAAVENIPDAFQEALKKLIA